MERVPKGVFTKEFKEEAVKMVTEGRLSIPEVGRRLSIPKSTLAHWVKIAKEGRLSDTCMNCFFHVVILIGMDSIF